MTDIMILDQNFSPDIPYTAEGTTASSYEGPSPDLAFGRKRRRESVLNDYYNALRRESRSKARAEQASRNRWGYTVPLRPLLSAAQAAGLPQNEGISAFPYVPLQPIDQARPRAVFAGSGSTTVDPGEFGGSSGPPPLSPPPPGPPKQANMWDFSGIPNNRDAAVSRPQIEKLVDWADSFFAAIKSGAGFPDVLDPEDVTLQKDAVIAVNALIALKERIPLELVKFLQVLAYDHIAAAVLAIVTTTEWDASQEGLPSTLKNESRSIPDFFAVPENDAWPFELMSTRTLSGGQAPFYRSAYASLLATVTLFFRWAAQVMLKLTPDASNIKTLKITTAAFKGLWEFLFPWDTPATFIGNYEAVAADAGRQSVWDLADKFLFPLSDIVEVRSPAVVGQVAEFWFIKTKVMPLSRGTAGSLREDWQKRFPEVITPNFEEVLKDVEAVSTSSQSSTENRMPAVYSNWEFLF